MAMSKFGRATLVARKVVDELNGAMDKHAPMNSAHEAYAVILEEVEEFWAEVMKRREERDPIAMAMELRQIAAMAMRAIIDLELDLK